MTTPGGAAHLYVHVPFCARRCAYCDFAIAVRRDVPSAEFASLVARELAIRELGGGTLDTLYFGGGTPSKLGGEGVARLTDAIGVRFALDVNAEVTLEANPEDVTPDAVRGWLSAGINRVSLGSQSFDPAVLAWMHRTHSSADVGRAVSTLRDGGIGNLSLDLIFSVPEMLDRDWSRDLELAIALNPDHLSVYGLTVESATPLGKWTARGDVREAPEERWLAEYGEAHRALGAAGFEHYEVSNYGKPGRRARHNEAYWLDRAYLGVGPSAHGFDGTARRWNESAYARWAARLHEGEDPQEGAELLTNEQRIAERVYLGLRSDRGLAVAPGEMKLVQAWIGAGWATVTRGHDSGTLVLTAAGWTRLDALATALTAFRSRY